jgi:hypothetical protein
MDINNDSSKSGGSIAGSNEFPTLSEPSQIETHSQSQSQSSATKSKAKLATGESHDTKSGGKTSQPAWNAVAAGSANANPGNKSKVSYSAAVSSGNAKAHPDISLKQASSNSLLGDSKSNVNTFSATESDQVMRKRHSHMIQSETFITYEPKKGRQQTMKSKPGKRQLLCIPWKNLRSNYSAGYQQSLPFKALHALTTTYVRLIFAIYTWLQDIWQMDKHILLRN